MKDVIRDDKGNITTQLNFDFPRFGNKEKDGENYVIKNVKMNLFNGNLYVTMQETYPNKKDNNKWDSFYVPKNCIEYFISEFRDFIRTLLKDKKANKTFVSERKAFKPGEKDEKKTLSFYGVIEDGEKKLSYMNISLTVGEKKLSVTPQLGGDTTFKTGSPSDVDRTSRFIAKLMAMSEELSIIFLSKMDGTYDAHMKEVAKNKAQNNPNTKTEEPDTSVTSYEDDEPIF